MRKIDLNIVEKIVEELIIESEYNLPPDVVEKLEEAIKNEESILALEILEIIKENAKISKEKVFPLCQDTGMAIIFLEIGQEIVFENGFLYDSINKGVENGYKNGYLRKSIVIDPFNRINTKNNLPSIIYTDIVKGDKLKITVVPKGFGAENQSKNKMFTPNSSPEEIIDFIVKGVIDSGSKGCPPGFLGIGIGGSFEYSALLAKKALLEPMNENSSNNFYREMELEIVKRINQSNIGPMGLGGKTTILNARILAYPTHIAGLPVSYNYCCHSLRHASKVI